MFNLNYNFMVHLKIFEIVESEKILQSIRDYESVDDLVEEFLFFGRMIATKWELVLTFD